MYRVVQKMYTLFTHQYLWNKLWQCLDADGGHFEHLHWIQYSRTSLISILLLYKYSSYDYRVIFFMSKCVYIILGHSVYSWNLRIFRKSVQIIQVSLTYSYSTTNNMHLLPQIIYSCKTFYMFRTVFPSIIRSSKLRKQQRYKSNRSCYLLISGMRWNARSISSPIAAAAVWYIPLLYTQFSAPVDGRKDRPKHVDRFTRINNLR